MSEPENPSVWENPPAHYALKPEPIEVIEAWGLGFHLGNAIKYIARAGRKGSRIEDLEKAKSYLEREIMLVKKKQAENGILTTTPLQHEQGAEPGSLVAKVTCNHCRHWPCRCITGSVLFQREAATPSPGPVPLPVPWYCGTCDRIHTMLHCPKAPI